MPPFSRHFCAPAVDTFPAVVGAPPASVTPPTLSPAHRAPEAPDYGRLVPGLAGGAALALVALALAGWLLARGPSRLTDPEAAWRRLGRLAARGGRPRPPSQTPIEVARPPAATLPAPVGPTHD